MTPQAVFSFSRLLNSSFFFLYQKEVKCATLHTDAKDKHEAGRRGDVSVIPGFLAMFIFYRFVAVFFLSILPRVYR